MKKMTLKPNLKIYDYYAPVYDYLADGLFRQGRIRAVNIVNENAPSQSNVLEIGIGTGLSLPYYHPDLKIVGIDVCDKMLEKARCRVKNKNILNARLLKMNAEEIQFSDEFFHTVIAMHVVSVIGNFELALNEMCRVCKPDGNIIILNHFSYHNRILFYLERLFSITTPLLGFRLGIPVKKIINHPSIRLVRLHKLHTFSSSFILHFKKNN